MRIVVPQPAGYPEIATLALRAEGLDPDVVELDGELAYGRLFRELWTAGDAFAIVEHDVAPWPGALRELQECGELLCGFDYCRGGNSGHSLGCTRFSRELLELAPDAWKGWGDNRPLLQWDLVEWLNVDAAVFDALAGYDVWLNESVDEHRHTFHVHTPAVAHVRREP